MTTSSGRRVKKRNLDAREGTSSRSKRYKRSKISRRISRRKSTKSKSLRPQRVATRNATHNFSPVTESSSDEDGLAWDSSSSESSLAGLPNQKEEHDDDLLNEQNKYSAVAKVSPNGSEDVSKPLEHPDSQINVGLKKKLVVKFSISQRKTPIISGDHVDQLKNETIVESSTIRTYEENPEENRNNSKSGDVGSCSASVVDHVLPENYKRQLEDVNGTPEAGNELKTSISQSNKSWGKFKIRTSNSMQIGNRKPLEAYPVSSDYLPIEGEDKSSLSVISAHGHQHLKSNSEVTEKQNFGVGEKDLSTSDVCGSSSLTIDAKHSFEPENRPKKKSIVLKLKTKQVAGDSSSKLRVKTESDASAGAAGDSTSEIPLLEEKPVLRVSIRGNHPNEPNLVPQFHVNGDEVYDNDPNISLHDQEEKADSPDMATDSARRARSFRLNATREISRENCNLGMGVDYLQPGTSRGTEKSSRKAIHLRSEGSKNTGTSMSSRNNKGHYQREANSSVERSRHDTPKQTNWLLLSKQDEGYRYIPQLGDEVVYLRQVRDLTIDFLISIMLYYIFDQ